LLFRFRQICGHISEMLDVYKCMLDEETALKKSKPTMPMSVAVPLSLAFIIAAVVLFVLFGRRSGGDKLKIN